MLTPFNKSNCLAMLNTLYPPSNPSIKSQPTRTLTPKILDQQRSTFWRYIQSVEKNGPGILNNVIRQNRRAERGEINGWPVVREVLDRYLRMANGVIDECCSIVGPENFVDAIPETEGDQRRNGRKVDSGISFASSDRPSTSQSSVLSRDKPLPSPPLPAKNGSALEKIARELRKLRDRNRVEETCDVEKEQKKQQLQQQQQQQQQVAKAKTLKKMKSTPDFADKRRSSADQGSNQADCPAFDLDEESRRRAIQKATAANQQQMPRMRYQPLRTAAEV